MFIDDFTFEVAMNGDADNFAFCTVTGKESAKHQESYSIEHATPEKIGQVIADFISKTYTEYTDEEKEEKKSIKNGDIVKVIGTTIVGAEEKEVYKIGTICKVIDTDPEDEVVELIPLGSNIEYGYWYRVKDLQKGEFIWKEIK